MCIYVNMAKNADSMWWVDAVLAAATVNVTDDEKNLYWKLS